EVNAAVNAAWCTVSNQSPDINGECPPQGGSASNQLPSPISFPAGGQFATYIAGTDENGGAEIGWDFIVDNDARTNQFANQARMTAGNGTNTLHTDCPFDYYGDTIRSSFVDPLFGSSSDGPIAGTACRKNPSRDIIGTIAGEWNLKPYPAGWDPLD